MRREIPLSGDILITMNSFITGLELSEAFYKEVVKPILDSDFSNLKYSAALIGWGSEVLGFDTAQSTDHHWGPRLHLFLSGEDYFKYKGQLKETLGNKLPFEFRGIATNFSQSGESGIQLLEKTDQRPVNHHVYIHTIKENLKEVKIDGSHRYIGSVNQFIDSADVLLAPELLKKLKGIYEG